MGIQGLTKLLQDEAPDAIKEKDMSLYTGQTVAIDASMTIYSFLIAVRSSDNGAAGQMLTNEAGDVTSHIQGIFSRTIRLLSNGIKPVFVFDGKPPDMKSGELAKRREKREKAAEDLKAAEESGTVEDVEKFQKRLVRVSKQQNDDCKEVLRLMGVPVVEAPCEAEAQCAELARAGVVFATATEDMDALTFATPVLLRRLTFAAARKMPVMELRLDKVLEGLNLTMEQFIDLCILCGCDYCDSIKGIGPKKALAAIRANGNIEGVLRTLDTKKFTLPRGFDPAADKAARQEAKAKMLALHASRQEAYALAKKQREQKEGDEKELEGEGEKGTDVETGKEAVKEEKGEAVSGGAEAEGVKEEKGGEGEKKDSVAGDNAADEGEEDKENVSAPVASVKAESDSSSSSSTSAEKEQAQKAAAAAAADDEAARVRSEEEEEGIVDKREGAEVTGAVKEEEEEEEEEESDPVFERARHMFTTPEVSPADKLKPQIRWSDPDEAGLLTFLVDKHGFNRERVVAAIERLRKTKGSTSQRRMDSFFKVVPSQAALNGTEAKNKKRKAADAKSAKNAKKGKGKAGGAGRPRK